MSIEALSPEGQFAAALAKAQGQIRGARKDKLNPAFKQGASLGSKYADLASVWDACRAALSENGLAVVQKYQFTEAGAHVLCCKLMHVGGHSEESLWPIHPTQNTPQGLGSAGTYARRYTLAAITGVAPDDDDDGNAASAPLPPAERADRMLKALAECSDLKSFDALAAEMKPAVTELPEVVQATVRERTVAMRKPLFTAAKAAYDARHAKPEQPPAESAEAASDEPPSDEAMALALTDGLEKCASVSKLQQAWAAVMLGAPWAAATAEARTLAEDTMKGIEAAIRDGKKGAK